MDLDPKLSLMALILVAFAGLATASSFISGTDPSMNFGFCSKSLNFFSWGSSRAENTLGCFGSDDVLVPRGSGGRSLLQAKSSKICFLFLSSFSSIICSFLSSDIWAFGFGVSNFHNLILEKCRGR